MIFVKIVNLDRVGYFGPFTKRKAVGELKKIGFKDVRRNRSYPRADFVLLKGSCHVSAQIMTMTKKIELDHI